LSRLPERIRHAVRAANIFREFTESEFESGALHAWAKKRFVESFTAYGELERDEFLLPDGEIKNLLAGCADLKALPASRPAELPKLPAEERLRVADELAEAAKRVIAACKPVECIVVVPDESRKYETLPVRP